MIKHYTSITDFNKKDFIELFKRTEWIKKYPQKASKLCSGKVIATLFFQPSTRTAASFQAGIVKLGGGWTGISGGTGTSMEKGEDFADTIETFSKFADIIIIRHPDDDAAEIAKKYSSVPIINGGCGTKEHPGVFVYVYDAYKRFGNRSYKFGIYGSPEISRMSKSLALLLGIFKAELYIDDLGLFPLPPDIEKRAKKLGMKNIAYNKLEKFLDKVDLLLVTDNLVIKKVSEGMQKENISVEKAKKFMKEYKPITLNEVKKMKKNALLSMIMPRTFEIDKEVDKDPRAAYFTQTEDFMYNNMALITKLLNIKLK